MMSESANSSTVALSNSECEGRCAGNRYSCKKVRAVAITSGKNVPSRRFRIDVLKMYLARRNVFLTELCPAISSYPSKSWLLRPFWLIAALLERLTFIFRSRGYDVVILQREMISTLPTLEKLLPKPWVLDVDDAIYLHRNAKAAEHVARSCSLVVCGNDFLAEKFSQWNPNIVVIPTGVDTELLRPLTDRGVTDTPVIGWIGTAGNYRYLELIEPALREIFAVFPKARLQIISNQFPTFLESLGEQLDFRLWQPDIENELLPKLTVGIMPLADNEWERGKCSFKMLQYMAAGIPVVASPVGMNETLLKSADVGFSAISTEDWVDALTRLLNDENLASDLGGNGRDLVEKDFSLDSVAETWSKVLMGIV